MIKPYVCPLALALWLLAFLLGTPFTVARAAPEAAAPRAGAVLERPTLRQLRPWVGHVVQLTLRDGKLVRGRIVAAWPGVLRLRFADGRTGAVARHRVQRVTYRGRRFEPLATQDAADSGRMFTHLGIGLTFGGLVLGGAAGPALFLAGAKQECPGILDCVPPATTAAIFITALSASAVLAGVPLWIAGVVRRKVHGRTGPAAARARRLYRSWGIGLTATGAGIAGVGVALLSVSATNPSGLQGLQWAGAITGSVGVFLSLCVGLPLWVEAARRGPAGAEQHPDSAKKATERTQDLHHVKAWTRHHVRAPTATSVAYGWRF